MSLSRPAVLALLAALLVVWFALLGSRDLMEADEGRYAEIPREMLVTGDWVTPRLDGFKYFEKPPLQYWLTAAGFAVFGVGTATARLWPALLGLLGAAVAGWLGLRLYGPRAGAFAFLALLTSLLYWAMGHILTLDMAVSVFLFVGIACLVRAQQQRTDWARGRRWMWLGWAALAAATLSKGLIGVVLPGGAVVLYSLWQRDWTLWKRMELGKGLLILLALTAPWFIVVSLRNPGFAWFFFVREHLERYATDIHRQTAPDWYFVPVFLVGTLPWTGAMVMSLVRPGFAWRKGGGEFSAERFLWVFAAVVFVFFSLGDSKLEPYLLPMIPAVAVLAGRSLANRGDPSLPWFTLAAAVALAGLAWVGPQYATDPTTRQLVIDNRGWFYLAAGVLVAAGLLVLPWRSLGDLRLGAYAVVVLVALQVLAWGYHQVSEPWRSSRNLAEAILAQHPGDAPIYAVGDYYPQSLPFYLRRTVHLVRISGELEMGIRMEPQRWIPTLEDFAPRWIAAEQAYAVLNEASLRWAQGRGLPMRELATNARLTVVARR
ncbi:MAG TPA: glycosyltransferase family 39 protein [bacterium]|nr:glycosyltransferase family 39 protein [bacterium]